MSQLWYYRQDHEQHGPLTVEEIKERAAAGKLRPTDLLWPAGSEATGAVAAEHAIDFAALPRLETTLPTPAPVPGPALPDWLGDVDEQMPRPQTPSAAPPLAAPPELPDWLEDVRNQQPVPTALAPTPPSDEVLVPIDVDVEAVAAEALLAEPPALPTEQPAADAEQAPPEEPKTKRDVKEAWLAARRALERWLELDVNRALIMSRDNAALRHDLVVREIVWPLTKLGPNLAEGMFKHLEFLAEGRRKFYQDQAKK